MLPLHRNQLNNTTMTSFETGKTYNMGWITDADMKTSCKVVKRTAKTVTLKVDGQKETKTCRIFIFSNEERVNPLGKYSMCPVLRASKVA